MNNSVLWLWLCICVGIKRTKQLLLLNSFKTIENIYNATVSDYAELEFLTPDEINCLSKKDLTYAENEFDKLRSFGAFILTIDNPDYPELLKQIYDPPALIYCKGNFKDFNKRLCLSVVGTRKATAYGKSCAQNLASALAAKGVVIVSGLALGIDTKAHEGSLSLGAPTVAVIGSGLDVAYPSSNKNLMKEIEKTGLVISEYPLGSSPERHHFPERNRIISGISQGIIVVEANVKSGSLITAKSATEQGRDVFAIPGNINSLYSKGTNSLIRDGAKMVMSAEDILIEYQNSYPERFLTKFDDREPVYSEKREADLPLTKNSPLQDKILNVLRNGPANTDRIYELTGIEIGALNSVLLLLELRRTVIKSAGGYYQLNTKF